MTTDVLVVGAGPTGLMLANQLGRRGIRTLIIDRHRGPAEQTRAMAVHARTLEIFAQLGVADRALALGRRGNGANMWTGGRRAARIPLDAMGRGLSPYPFVLMLGQDDTERLLGARLRDWGLDVRWNTELVALEQHADHVTARIRAADGTAETVTATYLAGCDGSRSAVRQMNGIGFPGEPYEHVFFVADTTATGPMVPDELNVYLWRDGFTLLFPMTGTNRWRVIGILPEQLRGRKDVTFDDVVPSLRREGGDQLSFHACDWFSTYRIHHRCTERFRDRRCFLLGDAAHVHSPMGGQGMNTGLQDAYNLAWKLALVVDGRADDALLDTYEDERLPVAHRLLETTDRAFRFVVSNSWLAGVFRTRIMAKVAAFAMRRPDVRRAAFHALSQIGISYPASPLSRTLEVVDKGAPRAGQRFPWLQVALASGGMPRDLFTVLDDTRFTVVVVGQAAPAAGDLGLGDLVRVQAIPADGENAVRLAAAHVPAPSFYVLRPDGHIGLAGSRYDGAAVRRWFADNHMRGVAVGRPAVEAHVGQLLSAASGQS
jgi:2-polyprenyl-6-methoxyphenol hydroxylase-like FAD-dependent oxidoreductase